MLSTSMWLGSLQRSQIAANLGRAHRGLKLLHCALFIICPLTAAAQPTELPLDAGVAELSKDPLATPVYVALRLNDIAQVLTIAVLLDAKTRQLWLNEKDMQRMRLRLPKAVAPRTVDGQRYFSLANIAGATFEFDSPTQRVSVQVPAGAYDADQSLTVVGMLPQPSQRGYSAYATYDVYAQRTRGATSAGGIFDVEAASPWGLLSATQFVARSATAVTTERTQVRRLDTTFTMDFPNRPMSVRFGDFVANSANGNGPSRIGGVQVASNFVITPGFVTYPTPTIGGQATLPSVAELFINGASIGRQAVAAGPFAINNVAAVSGLGEITLVVRDVLGREQVVVSSFYGSSQLLAPGLSDFSLAAGKLRYNYGTESNDYRDLVATGFWRYGVTSGITSSINAEVSKRVTNGGVGATFLVPGLAEASGAFLASRTKFDSGSESTTRSGQAFALGIDRLTQTCGVGARLRYASVFYRTVAEAGAEADGMIGSRIQKEFSVYGSASAGSLGSFTANYLTQVKYPMLSAVGSQSFSLPLARTNTRVLSLAYNLPASRYGQFSIGGSISSERDRREPKNRVVFVNYFLPLGLLYSVAASSSRTETTNSSVALGQAPSNTSKTSHLLTLQRGLPEGEGYGFRAQVGNESLLRLEGTAAMRLATLGLEYSQSQGNQGVRVSASGAISLVAGAVSASRRIADSFVVVDAGGFPGVRVYLNNNLVGRTDNLGRLFIPSLRSYQAHTISIEANDLPMSAELDQAKLELVTARSTGTSLSFPVRKSSSAQLRLVDQLGVPIPAGSVVLLGARTFPVAQDGEVFLLGLQASNELNVRVGGTGCRVQVPFVASNHVIPHLGSFVCHVR